MNITEEASKESLENSLLLLPLPSQTQNYPQFQNVWLYYNYFLNILVIFKAIWKWKSCEVIFLTVKYADFLAELPRADRVIKLTLCENYLL